ncbi:carbonic anhydrase 15-like [Limulus polyphemus]|uniref:carbonic anhydrase n=1 Tax=Limulus polyphemus TaxID=6850 RepID=A0ABM1TIH6_LIMPO|nr:carbonic anhydrase 15-like [Limulus polyphemus]
MAYLRFRIAFGIIAILFTVRTDALTEEELWSYDRTAYNGPDNWKLMFPSCEGDNQSPINIDIEQTRMSSELGPLVFHNFEKPFVNSVLCNSEYTANLLLDRPDPVEVEGGNLEGTFQFHKLLFHWDSTTSNEGSEHAINLLHYPLEMQLVAFNTKYQNITEALTYGDGIVAFAVLFKLRESAKDPASLKIIVENFENISIPGSSAKLTSPIYFQDLIPTDTTRYFRYRGSLTTPPCSEGVIWTIFEETVPINSNLLIKFNTLKDSNGNPFQQCHRPVQPLKNRPVLKSPRNLTVQTTTFENKVEV